MIFCKRGNLYPTGYRGRRRFLRVGRERSGSLGSGSPVSSVLWLHDDYSWPFPSHFVFLRSTVLASCLLVSCCRHVPVLAPLTFKAQVKASRIRCFEVQSCGFCTRCLRTSGPPLHKLCRQSPCIGPLVRTRFRWFATPFRMRCAFRRSHEVISKGFSYFLLSRAFVTQCLAPF
jgi:hypothetical protein